MSDIIEKKSIREIIKERKFSYEDAAPLIYFTSKYSKHALIKKLLEKASHLLTEEQKKMLIRELKEIEAKNEAEMKIILEKLKKREKAREESPLFSYRRRFSKEEIAQAMFKERQKQQKKIEQQNKAIEDFSKLEESKNSSKEIKF